MLCACGHGNCKQLVTVQSVVTLSLTIHNAVVCLVSYSSCFVHKWKDMEHIVTLCPSYYLLKSSLLSSPILGLKNGNRKWSGSETC